MSTISIQPPSTQALQLRLRETQKFKLWVEQQLSSINSSSTTDIHSSHAQLVEDAINLFTLKTGAIMHSVRDQLPPSLSTMAAQRIEHFYFVQAMRFSDICAADFRQTLHQLILTTKSHHSSLSAKTFVSRFLSSYSAQTANRFSIWRNRFLARVSQFVNFSQLPASRNHSVEPRPEFNSEYVPALLQFFAVNAYPSSSERQQIATLSQMSTDQITNWFQNRRNRAKKDHLKLHRPSPEQSRLVTKQLLDSWASIERLDESATDELSDDETVCDEEEEAFNEVQTQQGASSFPKKFIPRLNHSLPETFHPILAPSLWMRRPAEARTKRPAPNFDELCTLFTRLKIDTKRSGKARPCERNTSAHPNQGSDKPWTFSIRLCPGRHPAYVHPKDRDLLRPYTPPSTIFDFPAKEIFVEKKPKKRSGFIKRIPKSSSVSHPSCTPCSTRPLSRTSSTASIDSLTTLVSSSRSSSVESDYTSSEGPITPKFDFADLSHPLPTDTEFDVSFAAFNDNLDELFGNEEQLNEILSQLASEGLPPIADVLGSGFKKGFSDFGSAPLCTHSSLFREGQ